MRIATTTGDFQDYLPDTDVCRALELLAQCGFRHIDLNLYQSVYDGSPLCQDNWEQWADEIGNTAARLGLDFVQAHSSDSVYAKGQERDYKTAMIKREIQICRMLGIPGMVVHAVCAPGSDRQDFMEKNTEFYRELLETAEQTNVMVYTENTCTRNSPVYYLLEGKDFLELQQRLDHHPMFGCCWDVGHAHIQGVDQYREIMTMGKGLKAVHIHDNFGNCDIHQQPYSGNCSYDAIIRGLIDTGFTGCFTLEAFSIPEPAGFLGRKPFQKEDVVYDRLCMLPMEFKLRSERLMYDITRYMLESYGCYDE